MRAQSISAATDPARIANVITTLRKKAAEGFLYIFGNLIRP
jgi:hypothetical protein